MIRVPPQIAAVIAGLWAVAIAYTAHMPHLPEWAPYAIAGGGVILAAFGINIPQATPIIHSTPPPAGDVPPQRSTEGGGWG